MFVAMIGRDKPGALDIRLANRDAHVAYLKSSGIVAQAGPFIDENGDMCGSLVILSVETIAEAQAWVDADPYGIAGLFQSVDLQLWNRVIG